MSDMYRDHILDHARHPRHHGVLNDATLIRHEANPSCGDVIDVYLVTSLAGRIERVSFTGHGCAISLAATSLVLESVLGKSIDEVLALRQSDVTGLLGIEPGPMRLACALLPLRALQKVLTFG